MDDIIIEYTCLKQPPTPTKEKNQFLGINHGNNASWGHEMYPDSKLRQALQNGLLCNVNNNMAVNGTEILNNSVIITRKESNNSPRKLNREAYNQYIEKCRERNKQREHARLVKDCSVVLEKLPFSADGSFASVCGDRIGVAKKSTASQSSRERKSEYRRRYYMLNKEKIKANNRRYVQKNREKKLQNQKKLYEYKKKQKQQQRRVVEDKPLGETCVSGDVTVEELFTQRKRNPDDVTVEELFTKRKRNPDDVTVEELFKKRKRNPDDALEEKKRRQRECARRYIERNRERVREMRRKYQEKNRDKFRKYRRDWYRRRQRELKLRGSDDDDESVVQDSSPDENQTNGQTVDNRPAKTKKNYSQANREKLREYARKYYHQRRLREKIARQLDETTSENPDEPSAVNSQQAQLEEIFKKTRATKKRKRRGTKQDPRKYHQEYYRKHKERWNSYRKLDNQKTADNSQTIDDVVEIIEEPSKKQNETPVTIIKPIENTQTILEKNVQETRNILLQKHNEIWERACRKLGRQVETTPSNKTVMTRNNRRRTECTEKLPTASASPIQETRNIVIEKYNETWERACRKRCRPVETVVKETAVTKYKRRRTEEFQAESDVEQSYLKNIFLEVEKMMDSKKSYKKADRALADTVI